MRNQRLLDIGHAIVAATLAGKSWTEIAEDAERRLEGAGYQIVEKMPPNTVARVTTDQNGCIVRFQQKGEKFSTDPAKS